MDYENTEKRAEGKKALQSASDSAPDDWKQKIRFDRSFYAKIALAERSVKEYYAALATAILCYEKARSRMGWSGVAFSAGRESFAFIALSGKTLLLYMAISPEGLAEGKYKAKDVGGVKKRAKTPSLFRIKSRGALAHALKLIAALAAEKGLKKRSDGGVSVSADNFKADTFNNLITRGFIRIVKTDVKNAARQGGAFAVTTDGATEEIVVPVPSEQPAKDEKYGAYADTLAVSSNLLARHGAYSEILSAMAAGEGKARFSQKLLLRSIDEMWVSAIERSLPALDELIRKPARYIAETEEVLPIELTKRVSGRSVAHLARHTDYLSRNEAGDLTPTKLLNVFREDSLLTYENKFLNTLISRLYLFIGKRAKIAEEAGADEKIESFEFESAFEHGEGKGKIKISVEYGERNTEETPTKPFLGTGLWHRVGRLNEIVSGYMQSAFVKAMDKNYIRPPVMRTNAILKNKYFNECLALWEFIESYEDAGYGITVSETVKDVSDEYVKEIYALAAENYLVFLHNAGKPVREAEEYGYSVLPEVKAEVDSAQGETRETFFEAAPSYGAEEGEIAFALDAALLADEMAGGFGAADAAGTAGEFFGSRYTRTFHAKIRTAPEEQKARFARIANGLLKYGKVKMRESKRYASFHAGRKILARIAVGGKTLKVYFADASAATDSANGSAGNFAVAAENYGENAPRFSDTPVCIRVKGGGGERRAVAYIAALAEAFGLKLAKKPPEQISAEDYPLVSLEEMILKGWVTVAKRKITDFAASRGLVRETLDEAEVQRSARAAEEVTKNAVSESSAAFLGGKTESSAERRTPATEYKKPSAAQALEHIVRPTGNYEHPAEYGLDDSSGFISDEEETARHDETAREEAAMGEIAQAVAAAGTGADGSVKDDDESEK